MLTDDPAARWSFLGSIPYGRGLEIQEALARERAADRRCDTLLLLEHPSVVTLGRRGGESDVAQARSWLGSRRIEVVRTDRGGQATYHGPGQLVGYPIIRLQRAGRSVRRFVESLERVLCDAASRMGIADARPGGSQPGVWAGSSKIASIGIAVSRGVTRHGFSLNVDMDLEPFGVIVPCGAPGMTVSDLSSCAKRRVTMRETIGAVVGAWERQFGRIIEEE